MRAPVPYILVLVGQFCAQFAAQLGFILCFVGLIVTMPWAYGVIAHLLAQFERLQKGME